MKSLEVKCPGCTSILIVDPKTGKVLEHRKPLLNENQSTGDRFADARKRVESASERIEKQVEEAKRAQKDKLSKLESLFQERKKEIEQSGEPIEKPESPFGMD
jgi:hypothetical protein